jgi:nucleotide-binding universal stress UspA family protein
VVWRRANRHRITDHAPVLVGVDGSELSNSAVEQAFDLASVLAAPLIAAHTWTVKTGDTVAQGERALLSECLAGWTEKYPAVDVTQIAVEGIAADLLSDYSRDSQLVIVGSHGRSRIASALLGSTSQQLLGQSHAPLMICRSRHGTTTRQEYTQLAVSESFAVARTSSTFMF